jgi:hypothetical protein
MPTCTLRHQRETRMRDVFDYTAPFGPLGVVADGLFLTRYMRRFLLARNRALAALAEHIRRE